MTDFNIWIVTPENYPHSDCFNEVSIALQSGLKELGHKAEIVRKKPARSVEKQNIILAAHLAMQEDIIEDDIVFNLEQIAPGSPWMTAEYYNILRCGAEIWDYSEQNMMLLKQIGVEPKYCGIGYSKELSRIERKPLEQQDIDVLFYGSMNERRQKIINDLQGQGIKTTVAGGQYGKNLDVLIARAKVVLNMHFYESKVFEIVRCSFLLANNVPVVSENGPDRELEEPFKEGIAFAPYDQLVSTCVMMLNNHSERLRIAKNGHEIFKNMTQAKYLKSLVGAVTNV